ncbi:RNA polymerase sigma factor SigI [Bacillus sp. 3H-10]|uniref:RNA polymerase sigma factor SigI n=2 Tax=Bacillus aquiflavi TaxID=2672567 RepID=A0A6B3VW32_9BACI|nr:RNA polymerase sigma factor SigI [Bacillus aquiflavi]
MLSLLLMTKKRKKKSLENTVLSIQQGKTSLVDELIESYKPFIAKTVSSVCKRYINESDDEFSIGLIAFNEAIEKYQQEKGSSFLSFADVLIKRRVIDYIRMQSKNENSFSFDASESEEDGTALTPLEQKISIEKHKIKTDEEMRKEEIIRFQQTIANFGLSFSDLVEQSPKHADARKNAMLIAKALVEHHDLFNALFETKRLPIKGLEELVNVSRKTIERNRKYIIAVAIILNGDFVFLKDYIKGVLET